MHAPHLRRSVKIQFTCLLVSTVVIQVGILAWFWFIKSKTDLRRREGTGKKQWRVYFVFLSRISYRGWNGESLAAATHIVELEISQKKPVNYPTV